MSLSQASAGRPPTPISVKGPSPSQFCRSEKGSSGRLEAQQELMSPKACVSLFGSVPVGLACPLPNGLHDPWPLLGCGGRGGRSRRPPRAPPPFLLDVSAGGVGFLAVIRSSSRLSLCMEAFYPLGPCGRSPSVRSLGPPTPSRGRCQVTPEHPPAGAFFQP